MDKIKTFKLPNCAICCCAFAINGSVSTLVKCVKLPLVLQCAHSSCENCIRNELSLKNEVHCPECKHVSTVSDDFDINNLLEVFPINYYLTGLWYLRSGSESSDIDSMIGFTKPFMVKKKESVRAVACNECMESASDYFCKQCSAPYCSPCFKLVHLSARAFRDHVKTPILESYLNIDPDKPLMCSLHSSCKLEFYCTVCHTPICSHCMVQDHNGHVVDMLNNMNVDYQEEFIQSYTSVTRVLQRLKASKKSAEKLLKDGRDHSSVMDAEDKIKDHFTTLHAKLILLQNTFMQTLHHSNPTLQLEDVLKKVTSQVHMTETLLNTTKVLLSDEKLQTSVNFVAVIKNLQEKLDLPCYFHEDKHIDKPRFIVDEEFVKKLDTHCELVVSPSSKYRLVKEDDLPEDYDKTSIKEISREEISQLILRSSDVASSCGALSDTDRASSPSSIRSAGSSISMSSRNKSSGDIVLSYPTELPVGCYFRAKISHLISPSDFYVQRENAAKKLNDFQAGLRRAAIYSNKTPNSIAKGKIYLVLYDADHKWYRGRVVDISEDGKFHNVHYVDYGNSQTVTKDKLRTIPRNCLNMPILSYRCKLANCVPRNENQWDVQAIALMTQIIENDFVTVSVVDQTPTSYVVELFKLTDTSFINIQQALCFQELAAMITSTEIVTEFKMNKQELVLPQRSSLKCGDIVEVHTAFVNTPLDFYVQNLLSSRKLIQMSDDLQRSYNVRNTHKNTIYDPKKGMIVAARYSKDSKWYRGQILECLEGKIVKIFFIDFGNIQEVNWINVKQLYPRFYSLPQQAIRCVLADVAPMDVEDGWSTESCDTFTKYVASQRLKMVVEKYEEKIVQAVLYKLGREADICLNALLVREQLALSTGVNSTVVEFPKVYSKLPDQDCEVGVEKVKKSLKKPHDKLNYPYVSQLRSNEKQFIKADDGSLRILIAIKRLVSPGEFYVSLPSVETEIQRTEKRLQEFYNDQKLEENVEDIEWKVGDRCAIFDEKWFRAILLEIGSENDVKVTLPDEGLEKVLNKSSLRPLDMKFTSVRDGVVRCHLGGVLPALQAWSQQSVTEFQEFVHKHPLSLYMSKMSDVKDQSLPVHLFARIQRDAGPTEPAMDVWKSFNHYLRVVGQAKSDGITNWDCDGNVLNENTNEDVVQEKEVIQKILMESFKPAKESSSEEVAGGCDDVDSEEDEATETSPEEAAKLLIPDAWVPASPLESLEFVAAPTYVDKDGSVYLHDFHKSSHILQEISDALCLKYDNTLPKPHDALLKPGDICIAQYHLDNNWYRAAVLNKKLNEENEPEFEIQFVDYGNVEICKQSELRRIPVTHLIPIQCYKCSFIKVFPADISGVWNSRHIELIQLTIVDKNCQVRLVEIPQTEANMGCQYGIEKLTLPDGQNYIEEMIKLGYARFRPKAVSKELPRTIIEAKETVIVREDTVEEEYEETDKEMEEYETERDEVEIVEKQDTPKCHHWAVILRDLPDKPTPCYEEMVIPHWIETVSGVVTAFLSPTEVILHLHDENDSMLADKLEQFQKLSKEMQHDAPLQSPLAKPYKNKACCAMFSQDNLWYRAFVLEEMSYNFLLIQYVDFGNVETLPASSVREMKEEWTALEVQGCLAVLDSVALGDGVSPKDALLDLQDCLAAPVEAHIIKTSDPVVSSKGVDISWADQILSEDEEEAQMLKEQKIRKDARDSERKDKLVVELYQDEKLAYAPLIEKRLLKFVDDSNL